MATLSSHPAKERTKLMVVGDSGTGKTSQLAALANAGFRLFVLDFADGLDPLLDLVSPKNHDNIIYETLKDSVSFDPKMNPIVRKPQAYSKAVKLLQHWKDTETGEDYGRVADFGPRDIMVLDDLTHMGLPAFNYTLFVNKRIGKPKRINDWGNAIERQEAFVAKMCSPDVPCNVIVNAHLKRLRVAKNEKDRKDDEDTEEVLTFKRYPSALGQSFPPYIGSYFNTVLQTVSEGRGKQSKKVLLTVPEPDVDIKVPKIKKPLDPKLPLDSGLLTVFTALQQKED